MNDKQRVINKLLGRLKYKDFEFVVDDKGFIQMIKPDSYECGYIV